MRLSRTSGNKKRRVNRQGVSRKLSGSVPTHNRLNYDEVLLGNLFIDVIEESIIDSAKNYKLTMDNIIITDQPSGVYKPFCFSFHNKSYIEINNLIPHFGIEDFTIDWWEYVIEDDPHSIRTVFSISSESRVPPLLITNNNHNKNIFMSSDSNNWDITNNKYIGEVNNNQWTHWVVARCNRNFYTYKDGTLTNIWINDLPIDNSTSNFIIGSKEGNGFKGYICNFRVTLDAILWTEEFKTNENELYY